MSFLVIGTNKYFIFLRAVLAVASTEKEKERWKEREMQADKERQNSSPKTFVFGI